MQSWSLGQKFISDTSPLTWSTRPLVIHVLSPSPSSLSLLHLIHLFWVSNVYLQFLGALSHLWAFEPAVPVAWNALSQLPYFTPITLLYA